MRASLKSCLMLSCALAFLAGCPKPAPEQEDKTPSIVSFSASPTDLPHGGMVTLTWETQDAQSVELFDSNRGAISGADQTSGQLQVQVDRTTLFVLTAKGESGRTTSAVAQVRAGPSASELVLVAQPSVVARGGAVTLAWTATDPRDLRLSTSTGTTIDLNGQTDSGTVTVHPEEDTTFVLEAGGRRTEAQVKIRPEIVAFTATPKSAELGQPLTLTWKTTGASKITLDEPERSTLRTTEEATEVAEGSFELPVSALTPKDRVFNFRLRAEGGSSGVVAEKLLTVYVEGQSHIVSFKVPRYAYSGQTFTASWKTAEADQVVIFANGTEVFRSLDSATALEGSAVLATPTTDTTYELRATSVRGGEASATAQLGPVVKTVVQEAKATPSTLANGGEKVTLSWKIDGARRVRIVHSVDGTVFTGTGEEMADTQLVVYPNATGTYEIRADNTLGDSAVIPVQVSVTTPTNYALSQTGTILQGETVTVSAPAGGSTFVGFPHDEIDVAEGAAATGFIDITKTGTRWTPIPPADTLSFTAAIDFETWLYGEPVKGNLIAYTDGFFVIGQAAKSKPDNGPIPAAANERFLFAPFWDDLVFGANSVVLWEIRGEAPNKVLIVQWNEMQLKNATDTVLTFQAQVHQNGKVDYVYRKLLAPTASPTIGVQGPVATRGLSYGDTVNEGEVLTFFGPRASVQMTADIAGPFNGFVAMPEGTMRLPLNLDRFLGQGQLVISEVMAKPNAALGVNGQWIEVANVSASAVDLDGWTLKTPTGTHVIQAGPDQNTVIAPGGVRVFGTTKNTTLNGGAQVDYAWKNALSLEDAASYVSLFRNNFTVDFSWTTPAEGVTLVRDPGRYLSLSDAPGTAPHGLDCVGTTAFGDASFGQKGSPGQLKGCFGYRLEQRPVDFRDISTTGTGLMRTATSTLTTTTVSLAGTGAQAFGTPVSSLFVSRNGFVAFDGSPTTSYNYDKVDRPTSATPNRTAAIFGRALYLADGKSANVYLQRFEQNQDPSNPTAHWIIQWHKVQVSTNDNLNFEMKLFDDGTIEYHYGLMVSGDSKEYALGGDAVCWLEDPAGNHAQVISVQKPLIRPNTAFRFIPE